MEGQADEKSFELDSKEIKFLKKREEAIKPLYEILPEERKVDIDIDITTIFKYLIVKKLGIVWNKLLLNSPILFFTIKSLSKPECDERDDELSPCNISFL